MLLLIWCRFFFPKAVDDDLVGSFMWYNAAVSVSFVASLHVPLGWSATPGVLPKTPPTYPFCMFCSVSRQARL